MFKKVDKLMLVSFLPPFFVTFGIATFVLLMQILWVYIDDIAGKGLGMFMVMELMAYKCVGLVPMALPLAILISSVMVMGGLAERYELSSFKSAGVSLIRIMRPLIIFGVGAMFLSYWCSNKIIPQANLKFGSRMYDIQQKKPSMSMEAGVFNDDFGNYSIRIGKKNPNGKDIEDVLMYDHTNANSGKLTQVIAKSGQMFTTPDGRFFIMELYDGHQYTEARPNKSTQKSGSFPFVRTAFKSYQKVFDLSEFDMLVTNEGLFDGNRSMMGIAQLSEAIDSIQARIDNRYKVLANHVANYYSILSADSLLVAEEKENELDVIHRNRYKELSAEEMEAYLRDSSLMATQKDSIRMDSLQRDSIVKQKAEEGLEERVEALNLAPNQEDNRPPIPSRGDIINEGVGGNKNFKLLPISQFNDTITSVEMWLQTISPNEQRRYRTKAKSSARALLSQAESAIVNLDRTKENKVKHIYEMHTKFSMAVVCIIFVFVGAPLGAIVRKGGFGYPLLVSVVAFILFVVMTIFCRKIAETFIVPADLSAWLPCLVLLPIGLWLTNKARNDSKLFEGINLKEFFARIFKKFTKNDVAAK